MTASIHSPAASPIHAKKPVNTGLSAEPGEKPTETGGDFALLFASMMAGSQGQNLAAMEGAASPAASELQAQPLGSKLNIITTTTPVMSDESLLAFAKSQGLDEKALSLIFQTKPTQIESDPLTNLEVPTAPANVSTDELTAIDGTDAANSKLMNSDAALLKASLANATPEAKPAAQPNTLQLDAKPAAQPNTLQLDANSSMSWSVENPEQTKTLINGSAPVANEVLKPILFGLNGVRDGVIKPTTPPLSTVAELQNTHPEKQSLAASLIFAAPEAAQFAKRLQAKMALLKAPENMVAHAKPATIINTSTIFDPQAVSLPDPILDTLVVETELTGQELQSVLSYKQETEGENAELSAPAATNVSQTDAEERVQQYEKISQRVAEALGQRLAAQIARGDWKVDLTLKPHNLGNIGIELKMHKGELEASFTASNSATRDLIVDGLPKLRQTLGDLGMDIAHMDVNNKQERQNGGNSTPSQQQQQGNRGSASGEIAKTVTTSTPTVAASKTGGTDGLDVLV